MQCGKIDCDFGSGSQLWQSLLAHPARSGAAVCSSPRSDSSLKSDETSYAIRVKLMCSYGGTILPRPQDGELRYTGGETRIVVVDRGISLQELLQKMRNLVGKSMLFKYQLPGEDLDALISVKSDEDLDNMMEEYERLIQADSGSRLRVFLFSDKELEVGIGSAFDQSFVDALNLTGGGGGGGSLGIKDGLAVKSAIHPVDVPGALSPSRAEVPDCEDVLFGTSSSSKSPNPRTAGTTLRFQDPTLSRRQQQVIVNPAPAMTPLPVSLVSTLNRPINPQLDAYSNSQVSRNPFIETDTGSAVQFQNHFVARHGNWNSRQKQTDQ